MTYPVIHTCPICTHTLHAAKLKCHACGTVIENDFTLSKFQALTKEQMDFVQVFIIKRGNIKEVEKELGISYPTVRGRLNEVVDKLDSGKSAHVSPGKSEVITMLENGKISAEEAIELMKKEE